MQFVHTEAVASRVALPPASASAATLRLAIEFAPLGALMIAEIRYSPVEVARPDNATSTLPLVGSAVIEKDAVASKLWIEVPDSSASFQAPDVDGTAMSPWLPSVEKPTDPAVPEFDVV